MRTATCVIGEKTSLTVGDIKKILKRMEDSAEVRAQSHMGAGTYNVGASGVEFDGTKIVLGS